MEEIELLRQENIELKEKVKLLEMNDVDSKKYMVEAFCNFRNSHRSPINSRILNSFSTEIKPISSNELKFMNKSELLLIILYREANLYKISDDFKTQLKNNTRAEFEVMKNEIARLEKVSKLKDRPLMVENKKLTIEVERLRLKNGTLKDNKVYDNLVETINTLTLENSRRIPKTKVYDKIISVFTKYREKSKYDDYIKLNLPLLEKFKDELLMKLGNRKDISEEGDEL